jgi:hypothetical protein
MIAGKLQRTIIRMFWAPSLLYIGVYSYSSNAGDLWTIPTKEGHSALYHATWLSLTCINEISLV